MTAEDLIYLAMDNLGQVAPALLLFVSLMFADNMAEVVIRLIRSASKHYRL